MLNNYIVPRAFELAEQRLRRELRPQLTNTPGVYTRNLEDVPARQESDSPPPYTRNILDQQNTQPRRPRTQFWELIQAHHRQLDLNNLFIRRLYLLDNPNFFTEPHRSSHREYGNYFYFEQDQPNTFTFNSIWLHYSYLPIICRGRIFHITLTFNEYPGLIRIPRPTDEFIRECFSTIWQFDLERDVVQPEPVRPIPPVSGPANIPQTLSELGPELQIPRVIPTAPQEPIYTRILQRYEGTSSTESENLGPEPRRQDPETSVAVQTERTTGPVIPQVIQQQGRELIPERQENISPSELEQTPTTPTRQRRVPHLIARLSRITSRSPQTGRTNSRSPE